jgi:flagellar export protein FliJ
MKRFNFSLQKVLEVRERHEQDCMKNLALAKQDVVNAQNALSKLEKIKSDIISGLATLRKAGALDPSEQVAYQNYLVQVKQKIAKQENRIVELQGQEHERLIELVEASRELKALVNLKENAQKEYDAEILHSEQVEADDLSNSRHTFQKRAA